VECCLRLMFLKFRCRLGYESLCVEVADSISWRRFAGSRSMARCRTHHADEADHLLTRLPRSNPHVIKRKMSNWKLKRAGHRGPRQPSQRLIGAVTIVAATKTGPARRKKKQPLRPLSQRYWT
jgi:hypothetical protein